MDLQTVLTVVSSWPAADRLRLIEHVWDGLEDATPSGTQVQDLQRRLDAYRDNPKAGSPWEEVRVRLRGNLS